MVNYIESRDCDQCLKPFWDELDSDLCSDCEKMCLITKKEDGSFTQICNCKFGSEHCKNNQ